MPAQPGTLNFKSALEVSIDNRRTSRVLSLIVGPAQPGLRAGESTSKSGVATQSHYPLCAPAP
eukprot:4075716-Amphidinium_carterae.1